MQTTIVTSCNRRYLWGAILLIASIRQSGGRYPIHVWATDLNASERALLRQFQNVRVYAAASAHPHLVKPDAMLNVTTEYATWIDCDCMFFGHLDDLLLPEEDGIQIRLRGARENAMVFGKHYGRQDNIGSTPADILCQWKRDVNERDEPRFETQCVSNFITVHRKHFGLLHRWKDQLEQIAIDPSHPVDANSKAYFMTDESVLASLLMFAHEVPSISLYRLDERTSQRLIHFGQQLKPWKIWRYKHLRHYRHVTKTIQALKIEGYQLPDIPTSLNPRFKLRTFAHSIALSTWHSVKHKARLSLIPFGL
ncbi:hypothetical protein, partial [Oleiphilus sp. HI0080]